MLSTSSCNAQDNPDEILDLVDLSDQVIGQVSRRDAHRNPSLIHRCVQILVFNKIGSLLLQLRSSTKDMYPEFYTASASGHVKSGEDYIMAAAREAEEELGIVTRLTYLYKEVVYAELETEMTANFVTYHDGPFSFHPTETLGGLFFTLDDIRKARTQKTLNMTPGLLATLSELDRIEQNGSLPELLTRLRP